MRVDSIGDALGSYPKKPVHKPSLATSATHATVSQQRKNKGLFPTPPATPSATSATQVATVTELTAQVAITKTKPNVAPNIEARTAPESDAETTHYTASEAPSERPLSPHQPVELPRLFSGMLMTDQVSGRPLLCIHCGRRRQVEGSAWWVGECDICGERKGAKSRCSIISQELV